MSKTVEKWAAGFWCDRLYVAKGHFKKTKKQYRHEEGSYDNDMVLCLAWVSQFNHDTDLLHDTGEEALDALRSRELQAVQVLRDRIKRAEERQVLLNNVKVQA